MTRAAGSPLRGLLAVFLAGLLAAVLAACNRDVGKEPGVVAVVGGVPIRLVDLEARHDLGRLGAPGVDNPAVERLRAEYGGVLADMIVARLVRQELSRLHLGVTEAELSAAEEQVRADYPSDAFERMLLEERVDVARWREILRDRLALEKFSREVLRQNVRVDVSEAANYYKEHIDAFTRPARLRLAQVGGREAEAVKAALAAYRKSGQLAPLSGLAGITVREALVPEKNLPAPWREAVKGLKAGEASGLLSVDKESLFLVVLERQPVTVLDPAKAYARVESVLAARKLEKAFAAWLAEALAGTRITVNRQLLAGEEPDAAKADGDRTLNELAMAREETTARDYVAEQARKALAEKRVAGDTATPTASTAPGAPVAAGAATGEAVGREVGRPTPSPAEALPRGAATMDELPAAVAKEVPADQPDAGTAVMAAAAKESAPAVTSPSAPDAAPVPSASALDPGLAVGPVASTDAAQTPPQPPAGPPAETGEKSGAGEVEFTAIKASWILYTVDADQEERVYIKPGKPHRIVYSQRLTVRLGSPSEVTYRLGGRETTVTVGKKESRILEFP